MCIARIFNRCIRLAIEKSLIKLLSCCQLEFIYFDENQNLEKKNSNDKILNMNMSIDQCIVFLKSDHLNVRKIFSLSIHANVVVILYEWDIGMEIKCEIFDPSQTWPWC